MSYLKITESAEFVLNKLNLTKKDLANATGIILGSGLGQFAQLLTHKTEILYSDIPNFLPPTVEGHRGALMIGKLHNQWTFVLQGRLHRYEGIELSQVVLPVRVLRKCGIEKLIVTNSSGGVNPSFRECDLMLINDHINLSAGNPLVGKNIAELGPRFVDLTHAYDLKLRNEFQQVARNLDFELREGIYAGLLGPSYETPAEIRMLRILGADAVGMSTIPEVVAANHCGMQVAGIACITNLAAGILGRKLTHEEVVKNAEKTSKKLFTLLSEWFKKGHLS